MSFHVVANLKKRCPTKQNKRGVLKNKAKEVSRKTKQKRCIKKTKQKRYTKKQSRRGILKNKAHLSSCRSPLLECTGSEKGRELKNKTGLTANTKQHQVIVVIIIQYKIASCYCSNIHHRVLTIKIGDSENYDFQQRS